MVELESNVDRLQAATGTHWPMLRQARNAATEIRSKLEEGLGDKTDDDASLVVFGSLARGEWTRKSDIDWTLLLDGQTYPEQFDTAEEIRSWIKQYYPGPGREGTFGGLSFSHELVHRIGGKDDTNANLTQRMLLLLESIPIGSGEAHQRVLRALLERYITEDFGWVVSTNPSYVPRFLLNDIARYWRTVAVDFAYKRRDRGGEGWALRTVKLRLSRKLTYAAGLVACFRCSLLPDQYSGFKDFSHEERSRIALTELQEFLRTTPLEMLAWAYLHFETLTEAATDVFGSYNEFLALLDGEERAQLSELKHEAAAGNKTFERARELGHLFQKGLNALFLEPQQGFFDLTRTSECSSAGRNRIFYRCPGRPRRGDRVGVAARESDGRRRALRASASGTRSAGRTGEGTRSRRLPVHLRSCARENPSCG
ncbi:MAG: nucleotidyltransferase domain-containing protein [Longimicrobiaceae bacterium]